MANKLVEAMKDQSSYTKIKLRAGLERASDYMDRIYTLVEISVTFSEDALMPFWGFDRILGFSLGIGPEMCSLAFHFSLVFFASLSGGFCHVPIFFSI